MPAGKLSYRSNFFKCNMKKQILQKTVNENPMKIKEKTMFASNQNHKTNRECNKFQVSKKYKLSKTCFWVKTLSWFWIWPLFFQIRHCFLLLWTVCFIIYCIILRTEHSIANTESYKKQNKNLVCITKHLLVMN